MLMELAAPVPNGGEAATSESKMHNLPAEQSKLNGQKIVQNHCGSF